MFHPDAHLLAFWQLLVRLWLLQDDSIFMSSKTSQKIIELADIEDDTL